LCFCLFFIFIFLFLTGQIKLNPVRLKSKGETTMQLQKKILAILIITTAHATFAIDQAAKEETTPPDAAGPLTAAQIPPIVSTLPQQSNKSNTPAAPQPQPPSAVPMPSTNTAQ